MNMRYTSEAFSLINSQGLTIRGRVFLSAEQDAPRPTVILSHGFNGSHRHLADRAEAFAGAGIDCYTFDFCGGSTRCESDGILSEMMTIQSECADLRCVIDAVRANPRTDARNLYLMGESQGGLVTTLVAHGAPERFHGLILWYPALMIPEHSAERLRQGVTDVFGVTLSPDFDALAAGLDPWSAMPRFGGSVLIVQGDSDPVVPLHISEKAARLFPHARLQVIAGAGHGFSGKDLTGSIQAGVRFVKETLA